MQPHTFAFDVQGYLQRALRGAHRAPHLILREKLLSSVQAVSKGGIVVRVALLEVLCGHKLATSDGVDMLA